MSKPVSKPPIYFLRYESIMYKDSSHINSSTQGYLAGQSYAKALPGLSIERLCVLCEGLRVSKQFHIQVYRLSYALGYLAQSGKYDAQDHEQTILLDMLRDGVSTSVGTD